jgi:cystathionine beta-lyase/cystathionine gamma-synthase
LGIEVALAESAEPSAFERAIATLKKPRLIWVETPTNLLLDITDIANASGLAASLACEWRPTAHSLHPTCCALLNLEPTF